MYVLFCNMYIKIYWKICEFIVFVTFCKKNGYWLTKSYSQLSSHSPVTSYRYSSICPLQIFPQSFPTCISHVLPYRYFLSHPLKKVSDSSPARLSPVIHYRYFPSHQLQIFLHSTPTCMKGLINVLLLRHIWYKLVMKQSNWGCL